MLLACPSCSRQLNVPDEAAGKAVRCPLCQNVFQVPAPAPPAPHMAEVVPPAPPPPPPAAPPPPVGPARGYEPDPADQDRHGPEPRAEGPARRGAGLLMSGAIVFTTATLLSAVLEVLAATMISRHGPLVGAVLLGQLFLLLLLVATPVVFLFVGAMQLRRLRGRGLVLTGIILDFVLAGLLILIALIRISQLTRLEALGIPNRGTVTLLTILSALLLLGCSGFGIFAGCVSLGILNRPAVRSAYAARAPWRQPPPDYYDEDPRGGPRYGPR